MLMFFMLVPFIESFQIASFNEPIRNPWIGLWLIILYILHRFFNSILLSIVINDPLLSKKKFSISKKKKKISPLIDPPCDSIQHGMAKRRYSQSLLNKHLRTLWSLFLLVARIHFKYIYIYIHILVNFLGADIPRYSFHSPAYRFLWN